MRSVLTNSLPPDASAACSRSIDPRPFGAVNRHLSTDLNSQCRRRLIDMAVYGAWVLPRIAPLPKVSGKKRALYTPEQRQRRDASRWTLVQGILAPVQFLIFLVSLGLVLWFLATGEGLLAATASVVIKTVALYAIMVTGSIWEREVFGRYLFADAFYWEDMVSMLVLALHTLYLAALLSGALDARQQMLIALAAYATYVVNATQFLLKLRAARLERGPPAPDTPVAVGLAQ
jgi:3-vinyl bacteriochlorophyllide hydratase